MAELFVRIFISGSASDYGNGKGNDFIGVTQTLSDRTDEGKGMLGCGVVRRTDLTKAKRRERL